LNSKIIGIIILVIAIGGASAYFLSKPNSINSTSLENEFVTQNDKIGLVINTITPPQNIDDIEKSYKVAAHQELAEPICTFIGISLNLKKETLIGE
tara:strand:+ start:312 stop:599 length:288 start_codon:yes stop_codon:yes gene_type:complete